MYSSSDAPVRIRPPHSIQACASIAARFPVRGAAVATPRNKVLGILRRLRYLFVTTACARQFLHQGNRRATTSTDHPKALALSKAPSPPAEFSGSPLLSDRAICRKGTTCVSTLANVTASAVLTSNCRLLRSNVRNFPRAPKTPSPRLSVHSDLCRQCQFTPLRWPSRKSPISVSLCKSLGLRSR